MAETLTIRTASSTEVIKIAVQGPQGPAGAPGTGLETLTTKGDTLYRGDTTGERLPIGTSGQVLKVSSSGIPEWGEAPSGVSSWNDLTDKPASFTPSAHSSTHHTGGTDAIAPNQISAAWAQVLSSQTITGDTTLSSGRNRRILLVAANVTANVDLPSTDNQAGDVITLVASFFGTNALTIRRAGGTPPFVTVATLNASGQSFTFVSDGTATGWSLRAVDTHAQAASTITGLATVATTGDYDDLSDKPTIPTASSTTPQPLGAAAAGSSNDFARADHVHAMPSASDVGAAPATGIDPTAITGTAVVDSDARLSDSRTPTAHAASHAASGSDPVFNQDLNTTDNAEFAQVGFGGDFTIDAVGLNWGGQNIFEPETNTFYDQAGGTAFAVGSTCEFSKDIILLNTADTSASVELNADAITTGQSRVISFPDASGTIALVGDAPASHTHGNLTNDGKVGSTAGLPLKTGTAGVVEAGAFGTGAGEFAEGNHTHELANLDATGATDGHVLTADGAGGAAWEAVPAGDTVSINASAADVLSVASGEISAVDATADKIVFWDDSASELTYLSLGSGLSITDQTITATASGGSKTYAVFTATDNQPPSTAFATLDTRNSIAVLDFDDATDESAVFVSVMPEGASLGSGLKIRLHWMATSATSGDCIWDVSLERMTTDLDSDSFDTIASGTATANGTSGILTVTEITLTTIDSVTAGDGYRLKVTRDANNASDTMSGDAELVLCELRSAA